MGRRLQILQAIKPLKQRRDLQKGLDIFDRTKVWYLQIQGFTYGIEIVLWDACHYFFIVKFPLLPIVL